VFDKDSIFQYRGRFSHFIQTRSRLKMTEIIIFSLPRNFSSYIFGKKFEIQKKTIESKNKFTENKDSELQNILNHSSR